MKRSSAQRRICIRSLKNGICHLLMIAFLALNVGAFHPCFSRHRSRPQHYPVIQIESEVMFLGRHRLPSSSLLPMSSDDTTQNDDELQEWKAVVSAFQMYKAAYGDLKVPTRFVVPSMPPWPSKLNLLVFWIVPYMCLNRPSFHRTCLGLEARTTSRRDTSHGEIYP